MKISVTCIYWFLLLVSIVSSCLLFILVATEEGVNSPSLATSTLTSDDVHAINSLTTGDATPDVHEPQASVSGGGADIRSSFEEIPTESEPATADSNVKDYVLSQNSAVSSDGFSDSGHGVVFTLVDTASAELQQRAELPTHVTNVVAEDKNTSQQLNYTPTVLIKSSIVENKTEETSASSGDKYIVRAEPKPVGKEVGSEQVDAISTQAVNQTESTVEPPPVEARVNVTTEHAEEKEPIKEEHEDIPSFSEWTQKQLEEAEKKKEKGNTSSNSQQTQKPSSNLKLRSKNYASPDCGAKIVASNPEAVSAGSVLSPSRDEYKLNTCTSRIWFVVELCEAIQAKKIDLANFELFSSSPKDFIVSVSDRSPSRDWSSVGQFQAKDERDIQSFNLHPHLFGKFIKVELLSHWGSEHFCPISLFRVYGTSEFEVLETEGLANENVSDDDDDDETLDSDKGEQSNNLFGSARDAVMSIVKKAAEVLVKSGDGSNQTEQEMNSYNTATYTPLINTCSTPSHLVVCDNCSDILFGNVYELLSCKSDYLQSLINMPIVNKSLYNTDICVAYGLNLYSKTSDTTTDLYSSYISTFFAPKYMAALCNVLAVIENKVMLNISNQYSNMSSSVNTTLTSIDLSELETKVETGINPTACPTDETVDAKTCASRTKSNENTAETKSSVINEESFSDTPSELQIKPTKTLNKSRFQDPSFVQNTEESSISSTEKNVSLDPSESVQIPGATESSAVDTRAVNNVTDDDVAVKPSLVDVSTSSAMPDSSAIPTDSSENFEIGHDQLDKLLSELNLDSDSSHSTVTTTVAPPSNVPQQAQKESVFLRLSNRIKALERNMSLSGQYLEELSRRYKKQVEEMQRAFEKKLSALNDDSKKREEREARLQEQLEKLTASVESLLSERDSLWKTTSILGQFLLMEVFVTCLLLYFCWKTPENGKNFLKSKKQKGDTAPVKRRKSIDTVGHESPVVHRRRRPSEEALKIAGTYEDLLIDEIDGPSNGLTKAEKRRRRKKNALLRSQSVVACKELTVPKANEPSRRASSSEMPRRHNILAPHVPTSSLVCSNGDITPPARIQEIPFVLEESEHSSVEPVDYFVDSPKSDSPLPLDYSLPKLTLNNKVSKNGSIKSSILKSHSPLFMKTALSSRSKRNSTSKKLQLFKTDKLVGSENILENSSHRKSPDLSLKSNSYSVSDSQDDQTSLNSDTSIKKEKKSGGFKRIFKKVFD
ncbi:uncharacterized protein CBL_02883 [Carabus blaptoides fortunei]